MLGEESINIIDTYAPQIGLDDATKLRFWEDMDILIQEIPNRDKIFTGGDLNGHMGKNNIGFEREHEGYSFGDKNEEEILWSSQWHIT